MPPTGVTIKALGHIAALLGTREVIVPCDGQLSVSALVAQLRSSYPLFADYLTQLDEDNLLVLRDGAIQHRGSMVSPGEELTLVTPISGG